MGDRLQDVAGGRTGPRKGFSAWIAGRARRREYWLWIAPSILLAETLGLLGFGYGRFVVALPILFAMIRRLHDLGRSGWLAPLINVAVNIAAFACAGLIGGAVGALAGALIYYAALAALGAVPGQTKANEFGPAPGRKAPADIAETFA